MDRQRSLSCQPYKKYKGVPYGIDIRIDKSVDQNTFTK